MQFENWRIYVSLEKKLYIVSLGALFFLMSLEV